MGWDKTARTYLICKLTFVAVLLLAYCLDASEYTWGWILLAILVTGIVGMFYAKGE